MKYTRFHSIQNKAWEKHLDKMLLCICIYSSFNLYLLMQQASDLMPFYSAELILLTSLFLFSFPFISCWLNKCPATACICNSLKRFFWLWQVNLKWLLSQPLAKDIGWGCWQQSREKYWGHYSCMGSISYRDLRYQFIINSVSSIGLYQRLKERGRSLGSGRACFCSYHLQ